MKFYLFILLHIFLLASASGQSSGLTKDKITIAFYGDYRQENTRWSIAGNSDGQNPNVLSELQWKNLKQRGAGMDVKVDILHGIFFSGSYHRAKIYAGNVTDTDYGQDNRMSPTYQFNAESNRGHTSSYFAGLGYALELYRALVISPYAGYGRTRQFLFINDSNTTSSAGELSLNSTYHTNWSGPLAGLTVKTAMNNTIVVQADLSYLQSVYTGVADWNLIDAFAHPVSFRHLANGYQTNMSLQVNFQLLAGFSVFIKSNYRYAETGIGTDQLYLNDGRKVQSQFNGIVSTHKGFGLGISYTP